jgi:hypothetical protein
VAWHWMWLLPSGYVFLLQAGSIANDAFAAVFALAAVDFALRARRSRRVADVWLSVLAAALLTGSKLSNLPLLLPWVIAVSSSFRLLCRRPLAGCAVVGLAALASFLPTAVLNWKACGDWSGAAADRLGHRARDPVAAVVGNSLILTLNNLAPPFCPSAGRGGTAIMQSLPYPLGDRMERTFMSVPLNLAELPQEESAGLGLGLCALLLVSLACGLACRRQRVDGMGGWHGRLLRWSPFVALLAYMTQSGVPAAARLVAPYYPLLLPALLTVGSQDRVVRTRAWQRWAWVVWAVAVAVVVSTPSRPLWPAQTTLARLAECCPDSRLVQRARKVFRVYAERSDALAPMRERLPADAMAVGFLGTEDDPEASLWRPFGERRVLDVLPTDDALSLRQRGLSLVVVHAQAFAGGAGKGFAEWLRRVNGEVIAEVPLTLKAAGEPTSWCVVKLRSVLP